MNLYKKRLQLNLKTMTENKLAKYNSLFYFLIYTRPTIIFVTNYWTIK